MSSQPSETVDADVILGLLSQENLTNHPDGLDAADDLEYLLALVGEALREDEEFSDTRERVEWAVAQWCQEVGYVPDLREYETGQCVQPSDVPEDRETAEFRELSDDGDCEEVAANGL